MGKVLSVIIPVYNVEKYIEECIDSVLKQTFKDIEIILVDDGSPDRCPEICDKYAAENKNITVIHKENSGLSEARNSGLEMASGEYVAFLDSDDFYIDNDFFKNAFKIIRKNNVDMLMHQRKYYSDEKKEYYREPKPYSKKMIQAEICTELFFELSKNDQLDASAPMKIIRRSILTDNKLYFKKGILSEDVEWFFRLVPYISKAAVTNQVGYSYRKREGSITSNISDKHIDDMIDIVMVNAEILKEYGTFEGKIREALLNYLAYQYYIALGISWNGAENQGHRLKLLAQISWLSNYSISKKTKKAALLMKIFGVYISAFILGKYISNK